MTLRKMSFSFPNRSVISEGKECIRRWATGMRNEASKWDFEFPNGFRIPACALFLAMSFAFPNVVPVDILRNFWMGTQKMPRRHLHLKGANNFVYPPLGPRGEVLPRGDS